MKADLELFRRRKVIWSSLEGYGFVREGDVYSFRKDILSGSFVLEVNILPSSSVSSRVLDMEYGDEYLPYRSDAGGQLALLVRGAAEEILRDIALHCFEEDVFKAEQSIRVIEYVRMRYGDRLEFLWESSPECAILRRKDNRKWYAIIMTLPVRKLGREDSGIAEIIDLRLEKEMIEKTVDGSRYFPGWHMNKKHWYTIILDGSVCDEELLERVDASYQLALK